MLNHIRTVSVEPNYRLRLIYDDGETVTADFRSVITQGGVFAPLADPRFFSQAALDTNGRAVVWPGELEFCADALRLQWEPQETQLSDTRMREDEKLATLMSNIIIAEDL